MYLNKYLIWLMLCVLDINRTLDNLNNMANNPIPILDKIQRVITEDSKVVTIDLSNNNICDKDILQIANFCEDNLPDLEIIYLQNNSITEKCLVYFETILKRKNFKYLVVYGCNVGVPDKFEEKLKEIMHVCKCETCGQTMNEISIEQYMKKIIYIPKNWIDSPTLHISPIRKQSHKEFYLSYDK